MAWFRRPKPKFTVLNPPAGRDRIPKDLWTKCNNCGAIILNRDFLENFQVCPKCDYHARLTAQDRMAMLVDEGTFVEEDAHLAPADPLGFVDEAPYKDRVKKHQKKTGCKDAVITGVGEIEGVRTSLAIMNFAFSGGSMGSVVGEKVTRTFERAIERGLPVIVVSCTGGARMQEGILSLMQMAKTSIACARLAEARLPYISILTDPTTAGVMASYASLGDVVIAEPEALIGFAGPRVIEQTINQILPRGFQRSDFVREHGFLDKVVRRHDLKPTVGRFLRLFLENLPAQGVRLEQDPSEWPVLEEEEEEEKGKTTASQVISPESATAAEPVAAGSSTKSRGSGTNSKSKGAGGKAKQEKSGGRKAQ